MPNMEKLRQLIIEKYGKKYCVDTFYKAKRRGYTTHKMAEHLEGVTGIPKMEWLSASEYDPWSRVNNVAE